MNTTAAPPAVPGALPGDAWETGLWSAVDVFRFFTLAYAVALFVQGRDGFRHPAGAWAVLGVMAGWSVYLVVHRGRPTWLLWTDLALAAGCILATDLVDSPVRIAAGASTLPSMWAAAPVVSIAVGRGWRMGLGSGAVISITDLVEVWPHASTSTLDSVVQLLLLGAITGYTTELYAAGRRSLARATAVEAAATERDRLAADIHDSVLQVLAYVQHRGVEVGGEAAELGRLAGEQEARLRALVSGAGQRDDGRADLSTMLTALGGRRVSVAVPAHAVTLRAETAVAVLAAVRCALDNVVRHAGAQARAWVLLEDEEDMVTVTVRDDGAGMPPGRLLAAAAEGRLGVAAGIRARLATVGGTVDVTSSPGQGTEVELRVPRGVTS